MSGRIWRWERGNDWHYVLSHSEDRGWEFSGRGYGTSGYRTPIGAFIGWVRWYRQAQRWNRQRQESA